MRFLEQLYQILHTTLPNKVTYGTNIVNASELDVYPFIVYQEINNRGLSYADNLFMARVTTYQINLVTKQKDPIIEERLESALYLAGLNYQMISEYVNDDFSVNRVYEIKQEEFNHE